MTVSQDVPACIMQQAGAVFLIRMVVILSSSTPWRPGVRKVSICLTGSRQQINAVQSIKQIPMRRGISYVLHKIGYRVLQEDGAGSVRRRRTDVQ